MTAPTGLKSLARILPLALASSSVLAQAAELHYNLANNSASWTQSNLIWRAPNAADNTVWNSDATAFITTGFPLTLNVSQDLSVAGIVQSGAGTTLTLRPTGAMSFTLHGAGTVLSNTSDGAMRFNNGASLQLAPSLPSGEQVIEVGADATIYIGSQIHGASKLVKTGEGKLELDNANTYTGTTTLRAGLVQANHADAFGTSSLIFDGGRLGFGASAHVTSYTTRMAAIAATQFAKFEVRPSLDVQLAGAISGDGGVEKWGAGMLTFSSGNSYKGVTHVREGVLRAAAGATGAFVVDPFGKSSKIIIHEGATLDINGNGTGTGGQNTTKYVVDAHGKGTEGLATFWNSGGGVTNSSLFSQINFTSDISFGSDTRFDISGTVLNGGTNTFIKRGTGELAFSSSDGSTLGDIDVTAGTFTIQSRNLGSTTHKFILREGTKLFFWVNTAYDIYKHVEAHNDTIIRSSGSNPGATSDFGNTAIYSGNVHLVSANLALENSSGFRDSIHRGQYTGAGTLHISGSTSTSLLNGAIQTSTHFLLNTSNSFSGGTQINDSIMRLSNATLTAGTGGKLGNESNELVFNTNQNDGRSVLDLHGTQQTVGALNSIGTGTARIQNRRAGTTSTLKVGNGNADGLFTGIIEDTSATFRGVALTSDGTTGKIALEKLGSGTQTLTKANTFTGGFTIRAGTVQIGDTLDATSSAKAGNGGFTIHSGAALSGNGVVGHTGALSTVHSGGRLVVGVREQTTAQRLSLGGTLLLQGTLETDIWASSAGSGTLNHSDMLVFQNNNQIRLEGTLKVNDKTQQSTSWSVGTWFQVLDWTQVSTTSNREVSFSGFDLPTLGALKYWDYSQLAQNGRISVAMIPEPSRALLLVSGLIGLGAIRRRQR